MSGLTRDHFSSFRSAGKLIAQGDETTANCMKVPNLPQTPAEIRKYRKSFKQQHGVTIVHAGLADLLKKPDNFVFGKKTGVSDKVIELLRTKKEGIQDLMVNIQESAYASHKKEPLAEVPSRNYLWPTSTTSDSFLFGLKGLKADHSAKELVAPPDAQKETEDNRLLYLKSHGNFEAGEQKRRNYSWAVDPVQHRFGKVEARVQNQMKNVLHQEISSNQFNKTTILKKTQADFNNYNEDPVGRSKNLAQVNPYIDTNTLFGTSRKNKEWNAGQCIRGDSTMMEVRPDNDLGHASKFGWRNRTNTGEETRIFGVPTIRTDITRKGIKSVADPQNYGDEKPAIALMFPEKFSNMGLSQKDFEMKRSLEEIKSIFSAIGVTYGIGKFQAVCARAKQIEGTEQDEVSVNAFQMAVLEMHHIE